MFTHTPPLYSKSKMSKEKKLKQEELVKLGAQMEQMAETLWVQRHTTDAQSWYDLCDIVALLKGFNKRVEKGEYK